MTQDGVTRPWDFGRLVVATIVFASLALNGVLLWRWLGTDDPARGAPGVAAPGEERLAEQSPSPTPLQPLSAERIRERPQSAEAPSRPDGESRAAPGADDGLRGRAPDPSPPVSAGSPPNAQLREPVAPSSPGGVDPPGRSVPAAVAVTPGAVAVAPAQVSSEPAHAPESRVGGSAAPSSGPQTLGVTSSHGVATPPEAGARSPGEDNTPPEAGAATSGEDTTQEAKTSDEVEPGSDRTPPVLEVLRFDPPIVEGGNVTMLTVQASDDLSGVKSVRGEIRSPNRLATLPFGSRDLGNGNASTFALTIPRQAEMGVWYVSWISLTDGTDNSSLVQASSAAMAPPGGTLMVNSPESDSTAPEVLQIWFDKTTVGGGEKNVIRVEARDDYSGVASMMGACQSPSKTALIWFTCALNAESGIWEGDVPIPGNADCGEWAVQQLAAKDKAGNTTLLINDSPLLARAGFQVAFRADCDSTPPTLEAFDLSPAIVSNEASTEILVTARVYDSGSGAVALTGWFEGPVSTGGQVPKNDFRCSPNPNDPEAPWTGKVQVPQLAPKGTWKVGVIRLEDKARNFRVYTPADPVVSGRVFEVQ